MLLPSPLMGVLTLPWGSTGILEELLAYLLCEIVSADLALLWSSFQHCCAVKDSQVYAGSGLQRARAHSSHRAQFFSGSCWFINKDLYMSKLLWAIFCSWVKKQSLLSSPPQVVFTAVEMNRRGEQSGEAKGFSTNFWFGNRSLEREQKQGACVHGLLLPAGQASANGSP